MPWQRWLFVHGLELRPNGRFRFRTVLVLVARQNGKTTAVMVLALWRLIMDQARMVFGTSTNLDYARESWQKAVDLAWGPRGVKHFEGVSGLEGEFFEPRYANGQESLQHASGGRYKIGTASATGGRSMSNDLLILDELRMHKSWDAWSASSKTTNARPRGQIWALSNAGDDTSVVLNHLREKAIEGSDPLMGIFEWSAPAGCDTKDRTVWPLPNPALGWAIDEDVIASDEANDPESVFRTEVLCQRVARLGRQPVALAAWAATARDVRPSGVPVFFVTMAEDMTSATVSVAALHGGVPHVERADHRPGVGWLTGRLRELRERHPGARFAAWAVSSVKAWKPILAEQYDRDESDGKKKTMPGFDLDLMSATDASAACAHLEKLASALGFTHSPDEIYVRSLQGAEIRALDGGSWVWDWRNSTGDLAPISGATGALWLLEKQSSNMPGIF